MPYLEAEQVEGECEIGEAGHLDALVLVEGGHLGEAQLVTEEAEHGVHFVGVRRADVDEQPVGAAGIKPLGGASQIKKRRRSNLLNGT